MTDAQKLYDHRRYQDGGSIPADLAYIKELRVAVRDADRNNKEYRALWNLRYTNGIR